ncbi:MAG: hypothetical protein ACLFTF_09885 [Desulfonatronovibrio sp.]
MYCRKCRYVSFDHLAACPKCGQDWVEEKRKLGIEWLMSPGEKAWLDPGLKKSADEHRDEEPAQHSGDEFAFPGDEERAEKESGYLISLEKEAGSKAFSRARSGLEQGADSGLKQADADLETDMDFSLDFSRETEEKGDDKSVGTAAESEAEAEPAPDAASDMEPDIDIGVEPDLDFSDEAPEKKQAVDLDQEYEIDYPDLEFIESDKKDK